MKLGLCWTEAPARWAEANFPGEVVGVIGGVKTHMIPQALEDDIVAVLRKHSEPTAVAGGNTALERAVSITTAFSARPEGTGEGHVRWLVDAIHRAITEHGNAELGRRRAVEARLKAAVDALEEIECGAGQCGSGHGCGCDSACKAFARKARAALEENSKPEPDMRHKRAMQESQEYAKALKALEGDR